MKIHVSTVDLHLRRTFAIARSAVDVEPVVMVDIDVDGIVGHGEGAPVDYHGQTTAGLAEFCSSSEAQAALGHDPFDLEGIEGRLRAAGAPSGALMAVDGALHDWIGKRLGVAVYRMLGLSPIAPPTSFTLGIDSIDGTIERAREATGFRVLKVKVGGPGDLERLRAIRSVSTATLRIDGNEGWDLATARELTPELLRLGVEFVEQPFPVEDVDAYRAYHEMADRLPVILDEGCIDSRGVAAAATVADGINVKLSKTGGIREALRTIHAARALGLSVMLGCMIESQLGIAQAAAISSLVDFVDLDGHLLISDSPYTGLGFIDGAVVPSDAPGLGVVTV